MGKTTLKEIEKVDVILLLIILVLSLLYVDVLDLNEKYNFPINILDEPLILTMGILLGYFLAKLKFKKFLKKI